MAKHFLRLKWLNSSKIGNAYKQNSSVILHKPFFYWFLSNTNDCWDYWVQEKILVLRENFLSLKMWCFKRKIKMLAKIIGKDLVCIDNLNVNAFLYVRYNYKHWWKYIKGKVQHWKMFSINYAICFICRIMPSLLLIYICIP